MSLNKEKIVTLLVPLLTNTEGLNGLQDLLNNLAEKSEVKHSKLARMYAIKNQDEFRVDSIIAMGEARAFRTLHAVIAGLRKQG